jgi:hypothetical protein
MPSVGVPVTPELAKLASRIMPLINSMQCAHTCCWDAVGVPATPRFSCDTMRPVTASQAGLRLKSLRSKRLPSYCSQWVLQYVRRNQPIIKL